MPTTLTVSSGSGERVVVYPDGASSRSTSVHSPTSSEEASYSSSTGSDGWTHLESHFEDDGIEPEDSASRSRHPSSRRHRTEAPAPPSRHHSSRRSRETEDSRPHRHSSHKQHSSSRHHRRRDSRRVPSDESSSTVASQDDYPYSHRGMPRAGYPPPNGYRPMPGHGGYPPPSVAPGYPPSSAGGYPPQDPFAQQALVPHMAQQQDPFGYPGPNPFTSSAPGTQSNPFSPMETGSTTSYFGADMHTPQMSHPHQRPGPPGRPQSFIAPGMPGPQGYGSELMAHPQFHHPSMSPYGMHPGVHPGMPHPGMHPYAQFPYMLPPSHSSSPGPSTVSSHGRKDRSESKESSPKPPAGPSEKEIELAKEIDRLRVFEAEKLEKERAAQKAKEEAAAKELERLRKFEAERKAKEKEEKAKADAEAAEAALKAKEDAGLAQIDALKALIQKHEEERVAREAATIAKAEADAAEKAAKEAKAVEEKKRLEEIEAASAAAKEAAEKAAKEAADAAAKEHEEKLAEAKKAQEDAEKAKKELEEAAEKAKPPPDAAQLPIKFKDAVGRKFSFPWHLCKTWKGMESLIRQAFMHVDVLGMHVQEGHYDLMGPDGEIILPQVWETMIKPDWDISMHMWPMPEPEPEPVVEEPKIDFPHGDPFAGLNFRMGELGLGGPPPKKKSSNKNKKKNVSPEFYHPGPDPGHRDPVIPPPPMNDPLAELLAGNGVLPPPHLEERRPKSVKKARPKSGFAAWMAGGAPPRPKKDDEKLELVKSHPHKTANNGGSAHTDQTACHVM